ncbi:UNVERIFIED_CONTAM: hypothetical protein Sradi_4526300 [Sesamum radiatum]|uniref:DUF4283 domain-containing protein n=1 Tax=Sesamum radiatum TaxID=300843 RepID=A0AAW2N8L8_SESRA
MRLAPPTSSLGTGTFMAARVSIPMNPTASSPSGLDVSPRPSVIIPSPVILPVAIAMDGSSSLAHDQLASPPSPLAAPRVSESKVSAPKPTTATAVIGLGDLDCHSPSAMAVSKLPTLPEDRDLSSPPPQTWAAPPKPPAATAASHPPGFSSLQPPVSWSPAPPLPSIGTAPANPPSEILINNVPLKPFSDFNISNDKIAAAFHNSSRKTLNYIPPSVQNGEVLVRPTIDMIREGSNCWNTTVVGYFLGKRLYFHHLNDFVRSIWPAVRDVKATSNGFFFFQFKTMAGMEEVLKGGPWLFLRQPIVLQKWEPGMLLHKLKHTEFPVWIKLRHLPMELWTTDGLSTVASGTGRPLYPDAITRACTRLDFARVCVMLNVNSKLPKHIVIMMLNEHGGESACKVDVEYEWLPQNAQVVPVWVMLLKTALLLNR